MPSATDTKATGKVVNRRNRAVSHAIAKSRNTPNAQTRATDSLTTIQASVLPKAMLARDAPASNMVRSAPRSRSSAKTQTVPIPPMLQTANWHKKGKIKRVTGKTFNFCNALYVNNVGAVTSKEAKTSKFSFKFV